MLKRSELFKMLLVTVLLLGVAFHMPARADGLSPGSWSNGLGGTVTISSVGQDGQIKGNYVTTVGCEVGKQQPLTGWYYGGTDGGGAMTFSVSLKGCASVISWSGQYDPKTKIFYTLWHLTGATAPTWNGIVAGAHMFSPKQ